MKNKKQVNKYSKLILWCLILVPVLGFGQESVGKKIYLDSLGVETNYDNHLYYRVIESFDTTTNLYSFKEYYKSGAISMSGQALTDNAQNRSGEFINYYENGNKKSVTNYLKGRIIGNEELWHENGTKESESEYLETDDQFSTVQKMKNFWKSDGTQTVVNGNGSFENTTEGCLDKGNYKNGFKEGVWTGSFNNGKSYTEEYENGKLKSGTSTDDENNEYRYTDLKINPEPLKGINDFYKHIGKNFQIPRAYDNLKGKIITSFIVEKTGELIELKTLKSLIDTLDREAIRVVKSYGKWKPGILRGQKVRVLYSIPISLQGSR
ncbi:hypothetical protein FVB9288_02575 [Flavobacterium sp. CECT 9288]|uniref:energy transducer TonB n=1 Tax=Flavobacterium sp. CECT 9288 TaxID=2845819 RepID=UPI001E3AD73E|nr:energy transducer TonB [Flavobacterium sp. CECT 9288]CAH0336851.1 hypothetical protein FVB9288_02575 [Flavobacterium sp. CECT 9288]